MAHPITRSKRLISIVGLTAGGVALDLEQGKQWQGEFGVRAVNVKLSFIKNNIFSFLSRKTESPILSKSREADAAAANAIAEKKKVEAERIAAAIAAGRIAAADSARVLQGKGTYDEMYQYIKDEIVKPNLTIPEKDIKATFNEVIEILLDAKLFMAGQNYIMAGRTIEDLKLKNKIRKFFEDVRPESRALNLKTILVDEDVFTEYERRDIIKSCRYELNSLALRLQKERKAKESRFDPRTQHPYISDYDLAYAKYYN